MENVEWVMRIDVIFMVGSYSGRYFTFVDGQYYKATVIHGHVNCDEWTRQVVVSPHHYSRNCVQLTRYIKRKLMMWPLPSTNKFLAISPEPVIDENKEISVPLYPKKDQVLLVNGIDNPIKFVSIQNTTVVGKQMIKIRSSLWKVQNRQVRVPLTSVYQFIRYNVTKRSDVLNLDYTE